MTNTNFSNIKAIVFDLGGVLFREGKSVAIEKLFEEKNYDKEVVRNTLTSPKSRDLRAGLITDEDFWGFVQKQLPEGYDASTIKDYWYDGYILDEDIFNLVKKLHGKYKLFIFSGNIKSRVEYLEKKYNFRKYFDLEIYSYDYHFNKPQKEFVDVLVEKSELKPGEMVFIDDNEEVLKPAKDLGIKTAVYETGNIHDLENKLKFFGINI
jgi:FMN phosphatase YigB (HAD superfamily)